MSACLGVYLCFKNMQAMLIHLWDKVHATGASVSQPEPGPVDEEGDDDEEEDTVGAWAERRYDVAQLERERADPEMARVLSDKGGYRPQASVLSTLQGLLSNMGPVDSSLDSAASVELGMANATPDSACGFSPYLPNTGREVDQTPVKLIIQVFCLRMPCFSSS